MQIKKLFARPILPAPQTDIPPVTQIAKRYSPRSEAVGEDITNYIYTAESDGDMLIVTAYLRGAMEWRLFLTEHDYIVQRPDNKVSTAAIDYLVMVWRTKYYAVAGADEVIIAHFKRHRWDGLNNRYADWITWTDGIKAISALQDKQHKIKRDAKHDKIRRSIDNAMLKIRPEPSGLYKWAIKNTTRAYLIYNTKDKPGICTRCGASIPVKTKHGAAAKCPHCHAEMITICSGRYKSGGCFDSSSHFWYVQNCKDELCKRLYHIQIRYIKSIDRGVYYDNSAYNEARQITPEWSALINISEIGRYFFNIDGAAKIGICTKAYEWINPYNEGSNWYQGNSGQTMSTLIYPESLVATAKRIPELKYMPMRKLAKCGKIDPCAIFKAALEYPLIEYTAKLGLTRITCDIINGSNNRYVGMTANSLYDVGAKRIYDVLGVSKTDIPELIQLNPSILELNLYRQMHKAGGYTQEAFTFFCESIQGYRYAELCTALKYNRADTLYKYLLSQGEIYNAETGDYYTKPSPYYNHNLYTDIIGDYADYIDIAKLNGCNMADTAVIRPHNLHKAHADSEDDQQIARYYKEGLEYADQLAATAAALPVWLTYSDDKYIIRPIATFEELINESRLMRHCVGSYADTYAEGDTIILSVRRVSAPEMPLTTVEMSTDYTRFIQRRAYKNTVPVKEIMDFTDKFLQSIKTKAAKAG